MKKTTTVRISRLAGKFAENKDIAKDIRTKTISPALKEGQSVVIDFNGVEAATQSFIHALVSQLIRDYGIGVLDTVVFKDCSDTVKKIIEIVIDYMQHED